MGLTPPQSLLPAGFSSQFGSPTISWKDQAITRPPEEGSNDLQRNTITRRRILDGTAEEFASGQAKKLYDALKCPKDYMLFTAEGTDLTHCQTGAPSVASQRMFDWLDEHI